MPSRLRSFWQALVHRSDIEREIADEMRFHVDARIDDLMRSGLPRTEAVRRAGIEFRGCGGVQRAVPRCPWTSNAGRSTRRRTLRRSNARHKPVVFRHCNSDAGARHRRKCRAVYPGQHPATAANPGSGSIKPLSGPWVHREANGVQSVFRS